MPENLKNTDLPTEARRFLLAMKNRLPEAYTGIFGVNITGAKDESLFLMLSPAGTIMLRFLDFPLTGNASMIIGVLKTAFERMLKATTDRLRTHSSLKNADGRLVFPLRMIYVFTSTERIAEIGDPALDGFSRRSLRGSSWLAQCRKNAEDTYIKLLEEPDNTPVESVHVLTQGLIDIVVNRLAPWCTIPKLPAIDTPTQSAKPTLPDPKLNRSDSLVEVLRLEPEQVEMVNTIRKGHQLVLACAGSGKSVLLIARCFKLASMDYDRHFLLTCYNSNLQQYYQWQIDEAGLTNHNVECRTFHALCRRLLIDSGLSVPNDFNAIANKAIQAMDEGKIKKRYYGIFIDEVQIFNPEWYHFCLRLLEDFGGTEHVLAICGDITQDIRKNIRYSRAPWQGDGLPSFSGKTLHIEKNYRNCVPINRFINAYATTALRYLSCIDGAVTQDT